MRLPLQQRVDPLFDLLLVEKLLTHNAVDLRAQLSNTVFIDALQFRLYADQAGEDVIAKCEIGTGCDQPRCRDYQGVPDGRHASAYSHHGYGRDGCTFRRPVAPAESAWRAAYSATGYYRRR